MAVPLNNANAWIQRYRQDADYRNWVTNTWQGKAYGADGVVDDQTRRGITSSYGNAARPRECTGRYDRPRNSRHNANNKGIRCCSKWRNGYMGDNVLNGNNDDKESCGYAWTGNPEQMDIADLEPPPPPPPPEPAWMVVLRGYAAHQRRIDDDITINLMRGVDFLALNLNEKFYAIYDIYLQVCGNYPLQTNTPEGDLCFRCSALFNGALVDANGNLVNDELPQDEQLIARVNLKLNNMYYDLHRQLRTNYKFNKKKFKDLFIRLCNTLASPSGGNKNKKSRRFLKQRVNKTRTRTRRRN